jgi:hypothetical protein
VHQGQAVATRVVRRALGLGPDAPQACGGTRSTVSTDTQFAGTAFLGHGMTARRSRHQAYIDERVDKHRRVAQQRVDKRWIEVQEQIVEQRRIEVDERIIRDLPVFAESERIPARSGRAAVMGFAAEHPTSGALDPLECEGRCTRDSADNPRTRCGLQVGKGEMYIKVGCLVVSEVMGLPLEARSTASPIAETEAVTPER